ncbi:MAG: hypothetical protein DMG73_08820, partial [Acidobacteria bacterium]
LRSVEDVLQDAVLPGAVAALANVIQEDAVFAVAGYRKSHRIPRSLLRQVWTGCRIAEVAKLFQLLI